MKNTTFSMLSSHSVNREAPIDNPFEYFDIDGGTKAPLGAVSAPSMVEAGAIFICVDGQTEIVLNQKRYSLKRGDLCLVFPYTIFRVLSKSDDLKGHVYAINAEYIQKLVMPTYIPDYVYIKDNPCISLTPTQQNGLLMLCDLIKHKATLDNDPFSVEMTEHLLTVFSYEITAIYLKSQPKIQNWQSRQDQLFQHFLFSLTKNYRTHRDVEYYAQEAFITSRHFSFMIKQKSGKTAAQWITEKVVSQAKNLLSGTQMTVQQISEELHFANPSFFGQYFKKHTGTTPKSYRNMFIEGL